MAFIKQTRLISKNLVEIVQNINQTGSIVHRHANFSQVQKIHQMLALLFGTRERDTNSSALTLDRFCCRQNGSHKLGLAKHLLMNLEAGAIIGIEDAVWILLGDPFVEAVLDQQVVVVGVGEGDHLGPVCHLVGLVFTQKSEKSK